MVDLPAARRDLDLALDALAQSPPRVDDARGLLVGVRAALEEPRLPEPPQAERVVGAMIVNAGSCAVDLFRQAGLTHVAVELTEANAADFATARWDGFAKGWFCISRGDDADALAAQLAARAASVTFAIVDTESHKADAGGDREWTESLYARLREVVGPEFPLYNVTFGIHSSPEVVNHDAFRRHRVTPVWEAYDFDGRTLGIRRRAEKAAAEGWAAPHVAIGDKSVAADVAELVGAAGEVGGVWIWAPEQCGTDVLELAKAPR